MEDDAPEIAGRLVSSFLARVPRYLDQLKAAAQDGDRSNIETTAHALKGVAGNLGATEIAATAAELELRSGDGDLTDASRLIAQVEGEFFRLQAAITASPVY